MAQVVDPQSNELRGPSWPGKVFRPGEDGFTALMGTAHGVGISWLLREHRYYIKTSVTSITVFKEQACYHLRFDFG